MTTHYQKIQALGNRMASNLETMGVSASFNDGGLTLADKILMIQHFTNGLLLYGDKDIIQTSETVNLSAVLLKDGKAVSGETITFFQEIIPTTKIDTNVEYWCYTVDGDGEITFTGKTVGLFQEGQQLYTTGWGSNGTISVSISNSTLTVAKDGTPLSPLSFTYDSSKPLEIWVNKTYTILTNTFGVIGTDTTDSSGVASVSYVGKGTGKLNIKCINGTLQSETYGIMDYEWYDTGVTGTTSLYFLQNSDVTRSIGDDGTTISNSHATSSRYACAVLTSVSTLADTKQFTGNNMIEVDIISYTGGALQISGDSNASISLATYGSAPFTMQIKVVDGVAYYYTGSEWTTLATVGGDAYAIRFAISAGTTIKYKNWKIYPV